jgi:hypothetical protein
MLLIKKKKKREHSECSVSSATMVGRSLEGFPEGGPLPGPSGQVTLPQWRTEKGFPGRRSSMTTAVGYFWDQKSVKQSKELTPGSTAEHFKK